MFKSFPAEMEIRVDFNPLESFRAMHMVDELCTKHSRLYIFIDGKIRSVKYYGSYYKDRKCKDDVFVLHGCTNSNFKNVQDTCYMLEVENDRLRNYALCTAVEVVNKASVSLCYVFIPIKYINDIFGTDIFKGENNIRYIPPK